MNQVQEENVLLGALLDRLGKTQAQALLVRLDRWLSLDSDKVHARKNGFDQDQVPAADASYDRRRHCESEAPREQSKAAS